MQTITISIHAPLTGSDSVALPPKFTVPYFNPRSPHRERLKCCNGFFVTLHISIHAPLTGSDKSGESNTGDIRQFQSTLPSQGATANIHIKFLCDLLFSTLSSKNSFTLSRFPQTIT